MRHTLWNEASGISGVVYSLAQTADGFLWIGTSTGLYRFDGLKFEPFLELAGDHPIREVRALLATSDGGLWIGYRNGVAFLKQDKASFYTEQQGLPYGRVSNLAQTQDGAIWAAVTLSGGGKEEGGQNPLAGLARFSNGRWEKIGLEWNYPANSAENVVVDAAGTLWVIGEETIFFLLRGSRTFQQTTVKVSAWTEVCIGTDGSLWVADSIAHTLFNFRKSESHFSVTADVLQDINGIRFDNAGSLWLATGRGLYRILPGRPETRCTRIHNPQVALNSDANGVDPDESIFDGFARHPCVPFSTGKRLTFTFSVDLTEPLNRSRRKRRKIYKDPAVTAHGHAVPDGTVADCYDFKRILTCGDRSGETRNDKNYEGQIIFPS
jgi:hypothetical protein